MRASYGSPAMSSNLSHILTFPCTWGQHFCYTIPIFIIVAVSGREGSIFVTLFRYLESSQRQDVRAAFLWHYSEEEGEDETMPCLPAWEPRQMSAVHWPSHLVTMYSTLSMTQSSSIFDMAIFMYRLHKHTGIATRFIKPPVALYGSFHKVASRGR